jgi:hypothetical protein
MIDALNATPTTRETADHAELARLAEAMKLAHDAYEASSPADADHGRLFHAVNHAWDAWNRATKPEFVLALLSEIAELRGSHKLTLQDGSEAWCSDAAWRWFQEWAVRLEQAERQRDELRKALSEIRDEMAASREDISVDDWIEFADMILDNQGADQ